MKRTEIKELTTKSIAELRAQLVQIKKDIEKLEIEKRSRTLHNVALVGQKKKDAARLLTIIHAMEMQT